MILIDEADYLLQIKQSSSNTIDERPQHFLRAVLQSDIGTYLRAVVAGTTELSTYVSKRSSPFFNHLMPKSMELDENGEVIIEIKNTSSEVIKSSTIILKYEDIKYQHFNKKDSSNYLEFNDIGTNRERTKKMNFTAASKLSDKTFRSQIIVETDKSANNKPCPFYVTQRRLPIKTYWWIINPLILLVNGFIAKKELLSILLSWISQSSNSVRPKE